MGKRVAAEDHHDQQQHHHQHQHTNNNHHDTPLGTGARNIRKRKCASNGNTNVNHGKMPKTQRLSSSHCHNNSNVWRDHDDEDSSSNDGPPLGQLVSARNISSKQANNSSILLNNSFNLSLTISDHNGVLAESPKPVYSLRPSVINGTVLYDLNEQPWRLGRPIGKGNFGEIFLASDNTSIPVTNDNAKFVVKIEPHSNGPLFVEIHCLMNTAKKEKFYIKADGNIGPNADHKNTIATWNALVQAEPSGIPNYIASGSHHFDNARYRFLVLPRFDRDLHSIIKKCRVHQKSVLTLAIHIINVLENLHDKGYCHNDVKAQNLMISKCKFLRQKIDVPSVVARKKDLTLVHANRSDDGKRSTKSSTKYHYEEKQQTTDSGNSSEQEVYDVDDDDYIVKRKIYNKIVDNDYEESDDEEDEDDEDFDDDDTTTSINSNSMDNYRTPVNNTRPQRKKSARNIVQYSGSNPVRSCRKVNGEKLNSIYDEMVKSHYLRPTKRISYMKFFNEDNSSVAGQSHSQGDAHSNTSDDESEEFLPTVHVQKSIRKSLQQTPRSASTLIETRRLTRRQEKLLGTNKAARETTESIAKGIIKLEGPEQKNKLIEVEEERIFLIDYGLASKYIDSGTHRPFVMDQRRAHDGTLEFTSRDAHMGAHSRRSDMECLGYNLLFWSQGYLPWKEAATNQQQEKVHRAKEYLMTDVRELLRQIYGKQVPKYLGEYLHLVGQLAYHERPDYRRYRRIFEKEYQLLGYSLADMRLDMREMQRTCIRVKEEIENKNDFFDMTKNNGVINVAYSVMQNMNAGVGTPFHERTLSNRVSPKNLRSKSDKKGSKKNKFSWAEVLSQDPDQIARERAEKEFDREEELSDIQQPIVRRYQGKPTYAILEILERMGRSVDDYEEERDKEAKIRAKTNSDEKKYLLTAECEGSNDYEPMDVNDADESGGAETDVTETSELRTKKNCKRQRQVQKSRNSSITVCSKSKPNASRRLELKTPTNASPSIGTSVGKRTRCQKASIVKLASPQISASAETKLSRSMPKSIKRSSAICKSSRKPTSSVTVSAAASAAGEEEQQPYSKRAKRERRTRRRLIKTDQQTEYPVVDLLDDSSSNLIPEDGLCKGSNHHSTETVSTRNYKK